MQGNCANRRSIVTACKEIVTDPGEGSTLTSRADLVGVIANGIAVLSLGPFGPYAAKLFGITLKVALISHSTCGTANTPGALRMREAPGLLATRAPALDVEGDLLRCARNENCLDSVVDRRS